MRLGLMVGAAERGERARLARRAEEAGFGTAYLTEAAGANAFMDGAELAGHTDEIRIAMSGAHLDQRCFSSCLS